MIGKILMVIGALNWGAIGLGMLMDSAESWNVVNMLLGSMPTLEAIVYVLVGVAGLVGIFGCRCKKCSSCSCVALPSTGSSTGGQM